MTSAKISFENVVVKLKCRLLFAFCEKAPNLKKFAVWLIVIAADEATKKVLQNYEFLQWQCNYKLKKKVSDQVLLHFVPFNLRNRVSR